MEGDTLAKQTRIHIETKREDGTLVKQVIAPAPAIRTMIHHIKTNHNMLMPPPLSLNRETVLDVHQAVHQIVRPAEGEPRLTSCPSFYVPTLHTTILTPEG